MTGALAVQAWGQSSEPAPIGEFFGQFAGSAIASQKFPSGFGKLDIRDLDVTIKPWRNNGFTVSWSTVFRNPKSKKQKKRSVTMHFLPTINAKVWRAARSGDPLVGHPLVWARLADKALIIYIVGLKSTGESSMAIYRRTVDNNVMTLEFERRDDGKAVRLVRGHLKRQGGKMKKKEMKKK